MKSIFIKAAVYLILLLVGLSANATSKDFCYAKAKPNHWLLRWEVTGRCEGKSLKASGQFLGDVSWGIKSFDRVLRQKKYDMYLPSMTSFIHDGYSHIDDVAISIFSPTGAFSRLREKHPYVSLCVIMNHRDKHTKQSRYFYNCPGSDYGAVYLKNNSLHGVHDLIRKNSLVVIDEANIPEKIFLVRMTTFNDIVE